MDKLYEILEEIRPDVDFRHLNGFVTNHYIDSFDFVTIISRIEEEYSVDIPVEDMVAVNFDSAEAMMEMVQRSRKGAAPV